jgi:hypothetical protein
MSLVTMLVVFWVGAAALFALMLVPELLAVRRHRRRVDPRGRF